MKAPPVSRSDEGGAAAAVEAAAAHYARMLFLQRLRTPGDRAALETLFAATWGAPLGAPARVGVAVSPALLRVGRAALPRAGPWAGPGAPGAHDYAGMLQSPCTVLSCTRTQERSHIQWRLQDWKALTCCRSSLSLALVRVECPVKTLLR